jgi:hypothetical protein
MEGRRNSRMRLCKRYGRQKDGTGFSLVLAPFVIIIISSFVFSWIPRAFPNSNAKKEGYIVPYVCVGTHWAVMGRKQTCNKRNAPAGWTRAAPHKVVYGHGAGRASNWADVVVG